MQGEYDRLLESQQALEARIVDLEQQSVEQLQSTSKQLEQTEDLRAERDRFQLREQQLQQELERFHSRLQQAADRHQEKLAGEVQAYVILYSPVFTFLDKKFVV